MNPIRLTLKSILLSITSIAFLQLLDNARFIGRKHIHFCISNKAPALWKCSINAYCRNGGQIFSEALETLFLSVSWHLSINPKYIMKIDYSSYAWRILLILCPWAIKCKAVFPEMVMNFPCTTYRPLRGIWQGLNHIF